MRIYVAGPLANGKVMQNIREALKVAELVKAKGHCPFVPHLNFFWQLLFPHDAEHWLEWDAQWIAVCDAIVCLPGFSPGSENDLKVALKHGLRVFDSVEEIPQAEEKKPHGK